MQSNVMLLISHLCPRCCILAVLWGSISHGISAFFLVLFCCKFSTTLLTFHTLFGLIPSYSTHFSSGMSSLTSFALRFIPSMVAIAVAVTSVIVFYIRKRSVNIFNEHNQISTNILVVQSNYTITASYFTNELNSISMRIIRFFLYYAITTMYTASGCAYISSIHTYFFILYFILIKALIYQNYI